MASEERLQIEQSAQQNAIVNRRRAWREFLAASWSALTLAVLPFYLVFLGAATALSALLMIAVLFVLVSLPIDVLLGLGWLLTHILHSLP